MLLIVAFLLGGCLILQFRSDQWSPSDFMADFMGGFFVVFAFFKLLNLSGFVVAYRGYDIVAERWEWYAWTYPFIELALGVAYLLRWQPVLTSAVTLVVMVVGAVGVIRSLRRGEAIQCACLGTVFDLPMSTVTLIEDLGMAAMAAAMLFRGLAGG